MIIEFNDWRNIARLVYQNSKQNIVMYRSVISFDEEVASELMLKDRKAWQRYIENHIMTIAEKNNIKREHLQWAAALHPEKGHPHLHLIFWDTSSQVRNPYTHWTVPDAIRKQLIKDTFAEKIRAYGMMKNLAVTEIRQISNDLVIEFENYLQNKNQKKFKLIHNQYSKKNKICGTFNDKFLLIVADKVIKIKDNLPANGRIAYQLLPFEVKELVDALVKYLLEKIPEMQKLKESYIQSKTQMTLLYGNNDEYLSNLQEKFAAEIDKIIANRIIGMIKTLNRLDAENRSNDYNLKKVHYSEQMLLTIINMLSSLASVDDHNLNSGNIMGNKDLSKQAKKELYLKYQDKGFEH